MSLTNFLILVTPFLFVLAIGEALVSKLVGIRCASWFSIGCVVGLFSCLGGLMLGVFVF